MKNQITPLLEINPGTENIQVSAHQPLVIWFDQIRLTDVPMVGGKNASLGEMVRELSAFGVKVPHGFAITAFAYRQFIAAAGLDQKLRYIFAGLDTNDVNNLRQRGNLARSLILEAPLPAQLEDEIRNAYRQLCDQYGQDTDVADRAISYRHTKGFDHFTVALSVGVQKMVRSDLACSGVMFSIDPDTGFQNAVLISAAYGLGENVVQGTLNPDEYVVSQRLLALAKAQRFSKQDKK